MRETKDNKKCFTKLDKRIAIGVGAIAAIGFTTYAVHRTIQYSYTKGKLEGMLEGGVKLACWISNNCPEADKALYEMNPNIFGIVIE